MVDWSFAQVKIALVLRDLENILVVGRGFYHESF